MVETIRQKKKIRFTIRFKHLCQIKWITQKNTTATYLKALFLSKK